MKKNEMEDLVKLVSQFGGSLNIGQYNEGNGVYVENVYVQPSSDSGSESEETSDFEPFSQAAPSGDEVAYPDSPLESGLFNDALRMDEVKRALGRIVSAKRSKGELKMVHWFIVWKVFRRYRFIPKDKTQAKFIQWAQEVFGWDWKTMDFKGSNVPEALRNTPIDEWRVCELSSQRPQAEEYVSWRDLVVDAFLDEGMNGKQDCKESFCKHWFDTGLSRSFRQ